MFERYTDASRRAVFFARHVALARQANSIACADLIAGLLLERSADLPSIIRLRERQDELWTKLGMPHPVAEVALHDSKCELPVAEESRCALVAAAREADDHHEAAIVPDHLLRGVMLSCKDARLVLNELGVFLETVRAEAATDRQLKQSPQAKPSRQPLRLLHRYWWAIVLGAIYLVVLYRAHHE